MKSTSTMWDDRDLTDIRSRGLTVEEVDRQLRFFVEPPATVRLERPCTVGDGVLRLGKQQERRFESIGEAAIFSGRVSKFVPASGAATRMFQELNAAWRNDPDGSEAVAGLVENLHRFAFAAELAGHPERPRDILGALLGKEGLDLGSRPKALISFHKYGTGERTAFEEHLREAAEMGVDESGECRVHFTVSPEHLPAFETLLRSVLSRVRHTYGATMHVSFSVQRPSSETIAGDGHGLALRDVSGRLVFRPGGHGALLENLQESGGDIVLVRNVDNIGHERSWGSVLYWKKILIGILAQIERGSHRWISRVNTNNAWSTEASRWIEATLGVHVPEDADAVLRFLDRPLRVCGVVPNHGEPGGGPFWVRRPDGSVDRQIVESAQADLTDEGQETIFESATHFNPVDVVCSLRDWRKRPHRLGKYRDPDAVFVSTKSKDGRPMQALELPGLWNGAMADWITLFVEVPAETFHPVKTYRDLLRPGHQPDEAGSTILLWGYGVGPR